MHIASTNDTGGRERERDSETYILVTFSSCEMQWRTLIRGKWIDLSTTLQKQLGQRKMTTVGCLMKTCAFVLVSLIDLGTFIEHQASKLSSAPLGGTLQWRTHQ
jgi:hypothetical protein